MNKKGNFNIVELITYLVFVLALTIFIYVVAFSYLNEDIDTLDIETFILVKKLTYSDTCLAFQDELGVHQSIINLERLNTPVLINCYTKQGFGYNVKLADENENVIKTAANLNARQEAYLPICGKISRAKCNSRTVPVLYYEGQDKKFGYLTVEVIKLAV